MQPAVRTVAAKKILGRFIFTQSRKKDGEIYGCLMFYLRKASKSFRLQEDQDMSLGFLPFTHSPDMMWD